MREKATRTRTLEELQIDIEVLADQIALGNRLYSVREVHDMCNYMMDLQEKHRKVVGDYYHPERRDVARQNVQSRVNS